MTRPINASSGAWPSFSGNFHGSHAGIARGAGGSQPHPSATSSEHSPSDTSPFLPAPIQRHSQYPGASAAGELHWIQAGNTGALTAGGVNGVLFGGHGGPVTPGRLVCDGRPVCRGLLQPQAGQGMVAFARAQPPARGLVAVLAPGQLALVIRDGQAIGLGVEDRPLEVLPLLLLRRLQDFSALSAVNGSSSPWGAEAPQWALGLDMGHWSVHDRSELAQLAKEYRLGLQDLRQGVWVVDQLGGLHANWPAGVHFEPQPA